MGNKYSRVFRQTSPLSTVSLPCPCNFISSETLSGSAGSLTRAISSTSELDDYFASAAAEGGVGRSGGGPFLKTWDTGGFGSIPTKNSSLATVSEGWAPTDSQYLPSIEQKLETAPHNRKMRDLYISTNYPLNTPCNYDAVTASQRQATLTWSSRCVYRCAWGHLSLQRPVRNGTQMSFISVH